ncbi:radical SAM protein [Patescibacteria group bacterium]|nr:radical SAM protein [Patescibacteria group bacterium]
MRYKRVLLVNPRISRSYLGPIRPPAGLGYLAQYLDLHNIQHDVIDMHLGYRISHLWKKIEHFRPELIGITIWTYKYKDTYQLIKAIKQKYPEIKIVAGGPHISTLRISALKDCGYIDFGIVLEGEKALVELCHGKPLKEIKGLMCHNERETTFNGDQEFIAELDSLPFPKYDKFELNRYLLKEILIVSSRGCPYSCTYCPVQLAIGKKLRVRSAKNVIDEIAYWYNRGYRKFNIGDDNFTFFKDRVYEICDEIEKHNLKDLDIRCGNGVRADKLDKQLLERMREVGFSYIGLGVEAGTNRILKRIKKGESIEEIEEVIRDACQLGYDVTLFFLVGSPGENRSDLMESVKLAEKYPVIDARFYNIVPYPSTELFEWIRKNNLFLRGPEDYLNDASVFTSKPIFETPELSAKERVRMLKWLKKVERRIFKKGLKRKLSNYGLMGVLVATLSSTRIVTYIIRHNKIFRQLAENLRYNLSQKNK